ncbi:MAG TPA: DUF2808 domain-containing protein [Coleofasciculaceae cyanobacterium]
MRQISLGLTMAITTALLGSWAYATEFSLPYSADLDIDIADISDASTQISAVPSSEAVTSDRVSDTESLYYFTVVMPQNVEPFSRLSFSELSRDASAMPMRFDLINAEAFVGTPGETGEVIDSVAWMDETGTFWIEFNPSLASGKTLTVALEAPKPLSGKNYEYGIAAYTATRTPMAIFAGNKTLTVD